jgi:hypothetical protein
MPEDPIEQRLDAWAASQRGEREPGQLRPELERRLHAALAGSLAPVRALPSPGTLALGFFAVFVFLGAAMVGLLKLAHVHLMTDSQSAWMIAIFTGSGLLFSVDLAHRMIPGSRLRLPLAPALAVSVVAAIGGLALLFPWGEAGAAAPEGWRCAALEAAIAIPAAGVFWLLARRGAIFASAGLGVSLGGLAVLLALTPVQLQCMFPKAPHLLIWHLAPAAILAGSGALAANWRAKRWRTNSPHLLA